MSFGADKNGAFFQGGGVGSVKCQDFIASMEKGRALGIGSVGHANEIQGFAMYVLGFQTGYNMGTPDTYNIFDSIKDTSELLARIENECHKEASLQFGEAVIAFVQQQHAKRKKRFEKKK
jgi:hypothetical protein